MAENKISQTSTLHDILSLQDIAKVDAWIEKYPEDQKQSAVMATLMIVQQALGHLTPSSMDAVALYLQMPAIAVYEVASFYTMYEHKPTGRHVINVCTNISCQLSGCEGIVQHLEDKLSIKIGETTPDNRFTLRGVECLGACVHAPVIEVGQQYHEHLTVAAVDDLLEQYK